jgi:hypothetical protein
MKFKQLIMITLVLASAQSAFCATKCTGKSRVGMFESTAATSTVKTATASTTGAQ